MLRHWIVGSAIVALAASGAAAASGWDEDYDKALERAAKEGKYVLVDFSGSDWCGWCIKLDQEVFSKQAFKDYAKENLVLVLLDFPRQKSQSKSVQERNQALMRKYGVRGFPTVLVLNPKGEVAGRTGYKPGGPEAYVKHLKEIIEADKAKAGAQQ